MRKTAVLWLVLAAIAGGVLFHTSQRVTDGRAELDKIAQSLRKEDESLRVLQAEWSYLNQPDRLEKLAKKYFRLVPLKGSQFAKPDDLETRLEEEKVAENKEAAPPPAAETRARRRTEDGGRTASPQLRRRHQQPGGALIRWQVFRATYRVNVFHS